MSFTPRTALELPSREPEERFARIARRACRLLAVPHVTIAFLEEDRLWIKAGPGAGRPDLPRHASLFGRALHATRVVSHEDASLVEELADCTEVASGEVRGFACHPVLGPESTCVGSISAHAPTPRRFSPDDLDLLADLAALVEGALGRTALEHWRRVARELAASTHLGDEGPDWLFEQSLDLLAIAGFDGHFKQLSPSWETALGWSRVELMARPFVEFVHPEDVTATHDERGRLAFGSDTLTFQNRYRCRDGSYRWLQWKAHPSFEHQVIFAVARDVTDAKQAEEQLERAKEAAEAASRAKSAFLATVSHELRTPLNSILGFTRVLLKRTKDRLGKVERDYLERVSQSGRHLLGLVNSMLDLSRVEAGREPITFQRVHLAPLVEEVVAQMTPLASEKGLALEHEVPPRAEPVLSDPARMRQILFNLLGNALKFTDRGHVRVRVVVAEGDSRPLRIEVEDTGIGIPSEKLEQIFEPFVQVDSGPARVHPGTGLGLAISRALAERLGHSLGVRSVPGEGSVFFLDLHPGNAPLEGDPAAETQGS